MKYQSSYKIKDISNNVEKEIERLKAQVELFWNKEFKKYLEFGLKDGISGIELGCGPGFVIEKLLNHLVNLKMTGLEIDKYLVDYAENYLKEKYFGRYTVLEGSILQTGLADNTFDFAITRLVLEHLQDPVGAIQEVYRILKPGGRAVFIDNDFEMHLMTFPDVPDLRTLYKAYCTSRSLEGGNPRIGRELPFLLKKGGFNNIDFEVISAHNGIIGDDVFFKSEGIGIPMKLVREGHLSSKVLAQISKDWNHTLNTNDHVILRQLYMAVGEKSCIERSN